MAFHLVGVDLGGTKIATALTDTDCRILNYETVAIDPARGAEAVLAEMLAAIRRVTGEVRPGSVLGVGVAIAGQVEPGTGRVIFSPNLGWHDVPLGARLSEALGWPVYAGNDVNLLALGELHYGAARGHTEVLAVSVGTGVGAGMILRGELYQGAGGLAGELGQTSVRWDGPDCPGGNRGCLEHYVSDVALRQRMRVALESGEAPQGSPLARLVRHPRDPRVEELAAAHAEGDPLARAIVAESAEILAAGIASAVNLLNPEVVILAGGVIRRVPMLVQAIGEAVMRRALPGARRGLVIVPGQFGREGGVIGAAVYAKFAGQPTATPRR